MAWLCPTYTGCRADLPRFCLSAQRRERTPDCPSTKNRALNLSTSHRKRLIAGVLYSRFPRMSFLTIRDRLRQVPGVGQRRRLGVHAAVLDGAFHRVHALREQSLYPFIEEESWTVCVLVDHPRRQIVRQFPLRFGLAARPSGHLR